MWLREMNKRQIVLQKDLYSFNKFRVDNILKEPIGEIRNLLFHCHKMKFIKYYD